MDKYTPALAVYPLLLTGSTAVDWLKEKVGKDINPRTPVQVLLFSRYSSMEDAIVLMPEACAEHLGEVQAERKQPVADQQKIGEGSAYQPPARTRSTKPSRRTGNQCVIEKTSAREVLLTSSPTRSAHWGMDLHRLRTPVPMTMADYERVAIDNGFGGAPESFGEEAAALLKGAFALGLAQTRILPQGHTTMRLPLIHNQQDGQRYILSADRRPLGSPAMLHILAYGNDRPAPRLNSYVSSSRPNPVERKSGLLLHSSEDKRIRFYFPTRAQWAQWRTTALEIEKLPEEIIPHVRAAVSAAEKIAQRLGYESP
ncbi:MAG: hypothetical protein NTU80_11000 [Verrucomicrobia bacterium]|nr:hypothetical protein [Verrucomicrobiota bacterium]